MKKILNVSILLFLSTILIISIIPQKDIKASYSDPREIHVKVDSIYNQSRMVEKIEEIIPFEQVKLQEKLTKLRNILDSNDILHGGVFLEETTIVVQYVFDEQVDVIMENIDFNQGIKFKKVSHSIRSLTETKELVEQLKDDLFENIITSFIDEKENKVVLIVDDINMIDITEILIDEDKLKLLQFIKFEDQAQAIPYGAKILDTDGGACGVGFHGKKNSTTYITVTAGHCNQASSTGPWYYPTKKKANHFGDFTARTSGNTNSDAGYITLNSSDWRGFRDKISDYGVVGGVDWGGSEVAGDAVYISPATQDQLIAAGVIDGSVSINFNGQNGYNTINDLVITDATTTVTGDSGSSVYSFAHAAPPVPAYWRLQGLWKGLIIAQSGGTTITYGIYSKAVNAFYDLGLESIWLGIP